MKRIQILCGSGGVGKTSLSASLGIRAALDGKRTLVMTIDPAKRLASSLGLVDQEGISRAEPLDLTTQLRHLVPELPASARFCVYMPSTSAGFDQLLQEVTSDEALRAQIAKNPIYKTFSKDFSGTQDILALSQFWKLSQVSEFDHLILDTPPSRDFLSFLKAPMLFRRFFDDQIFKLIASPSNFLWGLGLKTLYPLLERLTGGTFLGFFFDFCSSMVSLKEALLHRLEQSESLLRSEEVTYKLVTTSQEANLKDLMDFVQKLKKESYPFGGLLINRSLSLLKDDADTHEPKNQEKLALELLRSLRKQEQEFINNVLAAGLNIESLVPMMSADIHKLEDLVHVARTLEKHSS